VVPSSWTAVRIASNEESSGIDEGEAVSLFNRGESVLLVTGVVPDDECEAIVESVRGIAQGCNETRWKANQEPQTMYRLPTQGAAKRAAATKTPYSSSLDQITDERFQRLFGRAIELIDDTFPSLSQDLFGGPISHLLLDPADLSFSSREPAVNIYTKGGQFLAHKDGQKLTMLIPLSSNDSFQGGGTAFWGPASRGHRVEGPSAIIKPPRGTMMLFAGHVPHAGLPLDVGERVVFVASFSPSMSRSKRRV
jgi:hypothetical protein